MTDQQFQAIVSSTKRAVLGAIRHHLSPQLTQWIDDVAQETYLRLYRHLNQHGLPEDFDQNSRSLSSLAYTIAKNESYRMNIKMGRDTVSDTILTQMPDQALIQENHTNETLSAALSLLDEELAPIVEMTAQGYSTIDIAKRMQIPTGTVKSRLFRARKKLKENSQDW
ncbi:MAG: sigma-70 family RNA polymerase sigma factor [Leptonema sp. (in: Bacteria)]|nr:sigma-70 family RNA polymerase sigma factor [Leptonema sp. (in: bacteria)]